MVRITKGALFGVMVFFTINLMVLAAAAQTINRGPYLQMATSDSMVVRWRTDTPTDSVVHYGAGPSALDNAEARAALATDHIIELQGLLPGTRYYYSVGTSSTTLAGGDVDHYFRTSPAPGSPDPVTVWVIGDSGTANADAAAVRDAYAAYSGGAETHLWLMLGDNAYSDGTDAEYQAAVFDFFRAMLRTVPLFPTLGNHDGHTADSQTQTGPYYDIFTLPAGGEAGGVPSGSEAYYSFDYGDIHFVVLDSYDSDRSVGSPMLTWLQNDLAANVRTWTVAYWHHPPYSKGSHDSDSSSRLTQMRENVLPILEAYGVDLVLSGHSHSFERSHLLEGHYGYSYELTSDMILDSGGGREDGLGAYDKFATGGFGAVYTVAGSSGKTSDGLLDHPAMFISLNVLGSVILNFDTKRLDVEFIDDSGVRQDYFTILKGDDLSAPTITSAEALDIDKIVARFSERLDPGTAENPANYSLDNGEGVLAGSLRTDGRTVDLDTTPLTEGVLHTLTVSNVEDQYGNPITPGSATNFTLVLQITRSFQRGVTPDVFYAGARDSVLSEEAPTTSFGASATLVADGDDPEDTGWDKSSLMFWDLSSIPSDALVEGATVMLDITNPTVGIYDFYEVLKAWSETTTTWNEANSGVSWGSPGAMGTSDRAGVSLASVTAPESGPRTIVLNVAGLDAIQGWVDGTRPNHGLILADAATGDGVKFNSAEGRDALNRPKLSVTYSLPPSGVDTVPPAPPVDLAATEVTDTTVSLSWTSCATPPCDDVATAGFIVKRDGMVVTTVTSPSLTEVGLLPWTTYEYNIAAFDAAGNQSNPTATLSITTNPPDMASVLVNDVTMSLSDVGRKQQKATAQIVIVDAEAQPVGAVTVAGLWSGLVSETVSGQTSASGIIEFDSRNVKKTEAGEFVFSVTDVVIDRYIYDPERNVESGDCIDSDGAQCNSLGNLPPAADFTPPAGCLAGAECAFADKSSDPDGDIVDWAWHFGDGTEATQQNPSHAYDCPGAYDVTLTVLDNFGAAGEVTKSVEVVGACEAPNSVSVSEIGASAHGPKWTATVQVLVQGEDAVDVAASWSGGVSADGACVTSNGQCTVISPDIPKNEKTVDYTVTHVDGLPVEPQVSITVHKP